MPCYTVQETKVNLERANPDILREAMNALGVINYAFNAKTGTVTVRGQSVDVADVKRAYSKQVVLTQAKRFGWTVKEQPDGKLQVLKASMGNRL